MRSIVRTGAGELVAGTDQGLFRYRPSTSDSEESFEPVPGTEPFGIYFVEEATDGALWLATGGSTGPLASSSTGSPPAWSPGWTRSSTASPTG